MFILIILFIFTFFIITLSRLKLHIDWKSLFKQGFSKKDNNFGLYTYTGHQGDGKTYSAIKFVMNMKLKNDYIVVTNIHSFKAFTDIIYIDNILELIEFIKSHHDKNGKKYIILFDEIFTILMRGQSVNTEILSFLAQLRKRSLIFVTTAQEWSEIPLTFRKFCRFQVSCNMFSVPILNRAFLINRINDGYNARWNDEIQDFEAPLIQTNFSKGNKYIIELYDTFEVIQNKKLRRE